MNVSKEAEKSVNELVRLGKRNTEGQAVVQIFRKKLHVNFYLGTGSFESFGMNWNDAKNTILYVENFDADSPKFFKNLNKTFEGEEYRERTIEKITEEIQSLQNQSDEVTEE